MCIPLSSPEEDVAEPLGEAAAVEAGIEAEVGIVIAAETPDALLIGVEDVDDLAVL